MLQGDNLREDGSFLDTVGEMFDQSEINIFALMIAIDAAGSIFRLTCNGKGDYTHTASGY